MSHRRKCSTPAEGTRSSTTARTSKGQQDLGTQLFREAGGKPVTSLQPLQMARQTAQKRAGNSYLLMGAFTRV